MIVNETGTTIQNTDDNNFSEILKLLIATAHQNNNMNKKNGYRFSEGIIEFSTFIFTLGGRWCYETLQANIPLPSLSTISRYMKSNGPVITEGNLRCLELKEYLSKRNLSPFIWISEDATRINGRIQYDSATNELIGFVSELDSNGLPKPSKFKARSAREIENHFKSNAAIGQQVIFNFLKKNNSIGNNLIITF